MKPETIDQMERARLVTEGLRQAEQGVAMATVQVSWAKRQVVCAAEVGERARLGMQAAERMLQAAEAERAEWTRLAYYDK
jgi:hypothetical protein